MVSCLGQQKVRLLWSKKPLATEDLLPSLSSLDGYV